MINNNFSSAFSQWWKDAISSFYSDVKTVGVSAAVGFTSALFLIVSYLLLSCSRVTVRDAAVWGVCALIGHLCHLTGAVLANQTRFQCIMASIMTTLEVVHLISVILPLCWWYHSSTGKKRRMLSRRRRQDFLVVCLLFGTGGCVYADLHVRYTPASYDPPASRKLLSISVNDQTELLGYVLGLLSFAISWTSRVPFFLKACRGELSNLLHVSSRAFSAGFGALYASAIVLHDARLEFIVKALPWILSGASWAILDFTIVLLSCSRICCKRQSVRTQDSEQESLLGRSAPDNKDKNVRQHTSTWWSSSAKMAVMKPFRNAHAQPIRKVCLKKVTVTQNSSGKNQPLKGSVKVVRVDERYSSGSLTDSSCLSSELEWDFEETRPQWRSQSIDQPKTDAFPLQEWTVDPRSKSNMRSSSSSCFCNSAYLEERIASGSPDTNIPSLSDTVK